MRKSHISTATTATSMSPALPLGGHLYLGQKGTFLLCVDIAYLSERALWLGDAAAARPLADRAWGLAHEERHKGDFIRAARLQGAAALGLGDEDTADERLHHALTRARAVNLVEEELPALVALAELWWRQADFKAAREFLDDVWESAERGPYPLFHADAFNVLAQVERDAGNTQAAVDAAQASLSPRLV